MPSHEDTGAGSDPVQLQHAANPYDAQRSRIGGTRSADLFISYSRTDLAFAGSLVAELNARGHTVWMDQDGIAPTEEWLTAIFRAIEAARCFVFILTPASAASRFCGMELQHATRNNKKLLPVLRRTLPDEVVPEPLRPIQWVDARGDEALSRAVADLLEAVDRDSAWVSLHTRFLMRALEWDRAERRGRYLLSGGETAEARAWLERGAGKDPQPTGLHREFIDASRMAVARRNVALALATVIGLTVAGGAYDANRRTTERASARAIWGDLDFAQQGELAAADLGGLWRLATARTPIRRAFLAELKADRDAVLRFSRRPVPVLRALGLRPSPEETQALLEALLDAMRTRREPPILRDLARALQEIPVLLTDEQAQAALAAALEAFRAEIAHNARNQNAYTDLKEMMQAVVEKLAPGQAQSAFAPVFELIHRTSFTPALSALGETLAAVSMRTPPGQAHTALAPVLDNMQRGTDPHLIGAMASVVQVLVGVAEPEQARSAFAPVLEAIRRSGDPNALKPLTAALQALAGTLDAEQAAAALPVLVDATSGQSAPLLQRLVLAMRALPAHPAAEQMAVPLSSVLSALRDAARSMWFYELPPTLQTLAEMLTADQARTAIPDVLEIMGDASHPPIATEMAPALRALAANLSSDQTQSVLAPMLQAVQHSQAPRAELKLVWLVQAVGERLGSDQAMVAMTQVLEIMSDERKPWAPTSLAPAVPPLALGLTAEQSYATLLAVLQGYATAPDRWAQPQLGVAARALAEKLAHDQAEATMLRVLEAIGCTINPSALQMLAQVVQALPSQPPPERAWAAVSSVLEALPAAMVRHERDQTEPVAPEALSQAVQALAAKLTAEQAHVVVAPLVTALQTTPNLHIRRSLAQALGALPAGLTPEQAQAALEGVLETLDSREPAEVLQARAEALRALAGKLTHDQARSSIGRALSLMRSMSFQAKNDPRQTVDLDTLRAWVRSLEVLVQSPLDRVPPEARSEARGALGWATHPVVAEIWAQAAIMLFPREPKAAYNTAIVELLKFPSTAGPATEILLGALRGGKPEVSKTDAGPGTAFVWLYKRVSHADLSSKANCPSPPYPGVACPSANSQ